MSLLPQYTHIVNKKLKHTYLSFDENANLIIKSPQVSQSYIEKLILKKSAWINRAKKKILEKKGKSVNFDVLYFYGQRYALNLQKHEKKQMKLIFEDNTFTLYYHTYDESLIQKKIDVFYKTQATEKITPLVESWAKTMNVTYTKLSFRKTKRQWGSCSSKNALSFNTMCIKLPNDVLQYIVVHELAHITHKHHQKAFWELVGKYFPTYKSCVKTLKEYTTY